MTRDADIKAIEKALKTLYDRQPRSLLYDAEAMYDAGLRVTTRVCPDCGRTLGASMTAHFRADGEVCPAGVAAFEAAVERTHPHDGYAYDGCRCVCCTNVRALAVPPKAGDEEPSLDAAWKAAEAALPEAGGWHIEMVASWNRGEWRATAVPTPHSERRGNGSMWLGRAAEGDSPAAALQALAAKLAESGAAR